MESIEKHCLNFLERIRIHDFLISKTNNLRQNPLDHSGLQADCEHSSVNSQSSLRSEFHVQEFSKCGGLNKLLVNQNNASVKGHFFGKCCHHSMSLMKF